MHGFLDTNKGIIRQWCFVEIPPAICKNPPYSLLYYLVKATDYVILISNPP